MVKLPIRHLGFEIGCIHFLAFTRYYSDIAPLCTEVLYKGDTPVQGISAALIHHDTFTNMLQGYFQCYARLAFY